MSETVQREQPQHSPATSTEIGNPRPLAATTQATGGLKMIALLQELERNSSLAKYAHFTAARRKRTLGSFIGIPVISINLHLGSLLFVLLSKEVPAAAKWTGALLSLVAATLSGIQTLTG